MIIQMISSLLCSDTLYRLQRNITLSRRRTPNSIGPVQITPAYPYARKDAKIPFLRNSFFNSIRFLPISSTSLYSFLYFPSYIHAGNTSPHVFFRFLPSSVSCFLKDTFFPSHQPALPRYIGGTQYPASPKGSPCLPSNSSLQQPTSVQTQGRLAAIDSSTDNGWPSDILVRIVNPAFPYIFEYLPFR